jgi:hypothetical protein
MALLLEPTVIHQYISEYLCYADYLSFKSALPTIKIKKSFKDIVIKRLTELDIDADEFLAHMVAFKNVISGSFILQCMYGTYWQDSDIDMFCCYTDHISITPVPHITKPHPVYYDVLNKQTFDNYIERGYPIISNIKKYIDKKEHKFISADNMHEYDAMYLKSNKYKFHKATINTILVFNNEKNCKKYKDIYNYVTHNFDLSFCKVVFDGTKLHIKNYNNITTKSGSANLNAKKYFKKKVYTRTVAKHKTNINSTSKAENVSNIKWYKYQIKRHKKDLAAYEAKYTDSKLINKVMERIIKYESRGFNICNTEEIKNTIYLDI